MWSWPIVGTLSLFFVIAALATPTGVGGGLLFSPILQIFLGYSVKQAVPLSQVLITGASIGSLLHQFVEHYTNRAKPLSVQTKYIWFILPAMLAGAVAGVLLAKISPPLIQLILMVLICGVTAFSIYSRAVKTYQNENEELLSKAGISERSEVSDDVFDAPGPQGYMSPTDLSATLRTDSDIFRCMGYIACLFSLYVLTILLRVVSRITGLIPSAKSMPTIAGVEYCGSTYWALYLIPFTLFVAISLFLAPNEKPIILTVVAAGALGTMSGISGGIVINPLLLGRGLTPQQCSATSIIIVAVISTASTFDFLASGHLPIEYAAYSSFTFVGSLVGMTAVAAIVKWSGRQSFLLFILGTLVSSGCLLTFSLGAYQLINNINGGVNPFTLQSGC